jgi:ATP-dependent helicase/nuclease subunit B
MSAASLSELLDALELRRGGVLALPNARAARELRWAFDARQRARGVGAWEPAGVLSWGQWTGSLWSELVVAGVEARLLLNAAQERSVWREIVAEDAASAGFGSVDALAEMAASGFALAARYEATRRLKSFAGTHDSEIFAGWAETFSRRCGTKGYLASGLLEDALRVHVERGALVVPGMVELVGFGEKTVAQESLLEAMRAGGTVVVERGLKADGGGSRASVVAASEREELVLAARWVRGVLEERPDARVAVLVPGLGEERAALEDVLREVLAPELQLVGADLSSTPWEIAGGVGLGSVGMIADVLTLARWVEGALSLQRVSSLLLSPYVGDVAERDEAARFDVGWLRKALLLRSEIGIAPLLAMADQAGAKEGRVLLGWLREVEQFLRCDGDRGKRDSERRGYAEWMEFVRGLGIAAGWPGVRALTATEFVATESWESALDTVSTLDFSGRRVTFAAALEALELQVREAVLALPSRGAAVEVMGAAEAEGSVFDAVVWVRATDKNWPAKERVHPLLPWSMQRSLKMPGSDSALAAAKARAFTAKLLERSGSVLFTSAAEDGDGKLRVSPVVAELGVERVEVGDLVAPVEMVERVEVESVRDDEALPALRSSEVQGGAGVLKLQAACGFLAFAQLRLRAGEPEDGGLGLDAGESGSVLHKALQAFWREVKTQEKLRSMSWSERDALLEKAIGSSLPRRLRVEDKWDVAYVEVVTERLRTVLRQWLELELERGPFEVLAVEQDQEVTVGPLTLSVRMDRIDRVEGGVFFVDYKTGYAADPKQWDGERPDDPQLPLYALLTEADELKGVAFAKVRAGSEMKWLGYQAEAGILPLSRAKNVRDLPALVEAWRGTLVQLAEEFAAGVADVRPKSFKVNCVRCGQRLLCRLDPVTVPGAEDEAEDEEDLDG